MTQIDTQWEGASAPTSRRQTSPRRGGYVARGDLDRFAQAMGRAVGEAIEPLRKRIAELEAKQIHLGGVWKSGERYAKNTLGTHRGGLWVSRAPTSNRPGENAEWRLAVKAGSLSGDAK